jgi:ParB family chromosome partitioning protein
MTNAPSAVKPIAVGLDQIKPNPWRDFGLFPIDQDHVEGLKQSIGRHDFFGGIKARERDGFFEIAFGHHRVEAARLAGLTSIEILVGDISDDDMLNLMVTENGQQRGSSPGAMMNEVAAVTRRLIEGLLKTGTIIPVSVAGAFESKAAIEMARGKLRNDSNTHLLLGHNVIRAYLGQGNKDRSPRSERQVREAISALKQSGVYDRIVEQALLEHPQPVADAGPNAKAVAKSEPKPKRIPTLDPRTAEVFENDHQFHAFRTAVTTHAAQRFIPVDSTLAKQIVGGQFASKKPSARSTSKPSLPAMCAMRGARKPRSTRKKSGCFIGSSAAQKS